MNFQFDYRLVCILRIIIAGICVIAPAVICFGISELFRKLGLIKHGDLKLDL